MLNWFRFLCLLITALAVFTGWVWTERSQWVYAVDWHLTKFYEGDTAERLKEIRKGVLKGDIDRDAGLAELRKIQSDNAEAVFGDRKFPFWRQATELLSEFLEKDGRYGEVVEVLDSVPTKDPTHIPLQLRLATALCLTGDPADTEKAQAIVDRWKYRIPNHPDLQGALGLLRANARDAAGLADLLIHSLYKTVPSLTRGWQVFLFPQGEGSVVKSPLMDLDGPDANGLYALEFEFPEVPAKLFQLRLDGPIFTRMRLSEVSVAMTMAGESVEGSEAWTWTSFVAVEALPDGSYALQSDKDPRMRMRFPQALPAEAPVLVRVQFRIDPILSPMLRERLAEPEFRAAVQSELRAQRWTGRLDDVSPLPLVTGEAQ